MGTKGRAKNLTRQAVKMALAAYVPAFIYIHFRYARHNFRVWAALFVAPFLSIKLGLIRLIDRFANGSQIVWHYDLIAIFAISVCFYAAERFDKFRYLYVRAVPIVIFLGLIYWFDGQGSGQTIGRIVKIALIGYLSFRIGKFTIDRGYQQLDDGADADYHAAKDFYDAQDYKAALPLLEAAAARGHFKSFYLLGDAYEAGHHVKRDQVRAAAYFHKASQKGYRPATARYENILSKLTPEQLVALGQLAETMPIHF